MSWSCGLPFRFLVGIGAFLAVSLYTPPTISSIPESRPQPPSIDSVVVLEELREWVEGVTGGPELRPLRASEIGREIRDRSRGFELFRSYHPEKKVRGLLKGLPYGDLIARYSNRHGVDGLLVAAIVEAESGFNPYAISAVGALGLMQVMPSTADLLGAENPLDPAVNIDAGTRYLSRLLSQFGGDVELALAAYNAGPGKVVRFQGVPPYRETRGYVSKVLDRYVAHHQTLWRDHMRRDWHQS
jgi:hypothetical protein